MQGDQALQTGDILGGRFRIIRQIGSGGMGTIYEAEHMVLQARVAIKVLHPRYAQRQDIAMRFQREARSASSIQHPNIIEIIDICQDNSGLYIVMELLEGDNLKTILQRREVLSEQDTLEMAFQVLEGVQAAHQKGVIHRDLKPENIFVTQVNEQPHIKIVDFGISKLQHAEESTQLTETGAVLGTPGYLAPEQARGDKDVDEGVDIWAMGVTIFQMLTGRRPFVADNYNALMFQIMTREAPSLQKYGFDSKIAELIASCLEKDREDRPENIGDLLDSLKKYASSIDLPVRTNSSTAQKKPPETLKNNLSIIESTAETETFGPTESLALSKEFTALSFWKRTFWYAGTFTFVWLSSLFAPKIAGISSNQTLLQGFPEWLPLVLLGLTGSLLALGIEQGRNRGQWSPWLYEKGLFILPVVASVCLLIFFLMLQGHRNAYLLPLQSYVELNPTQAFAMSQEVSQRTHKFLSIALFFLLGLAQTTLLLLLSFFLLNPGPSISKTREPYWFALLGFLGICCGEYFFWLQLSWMGYFRYLLYGIAILTIYRATYLVNASWTQPVLAWHALQMGAISLFGWMGVQIITGFFKVDQLLSQRFSATLAAKGLLDDKRGFVASIHAGMEAGTITQTLILGGFFCALAVILFMNNRVQLRSKTILFSVSLLTLTAFPLFLVFATMQNMNERWLPLKLSQMTPVISKAVPSGNFYIDNKPQTLQKGKAQFWSKLTGKPDYLFKRGELIKILSGAQRCLKQLKASLTTHSPEAYARCLTGKEAQQYCLARGKRLPTPTEWKLALQHRTIGKNESSRLEKTRLAEWSFLPDKAQFALQNRSKRVHASKPLKGQFFAAWLGFRCVYQFPTKRLQK